MLRSFLSLQNESTHCVVIIITSRIVLINWALEQMGGCNSLQINVWNWCWVLIAFALRGNILFCRRHRRERGGYRNFSCGFRPLEAVRNTRNAIYNSYLLSIWNRWPVRKYWVKYRLFLTQNVLMTIVNYYTGFLCLQEYCGTGRQNRPQPFH